MLPDAQFLQLPGVNLLFRDNQCSGPRVVFIHANTASSAIWEPQYKHFTRIGFRIVSFDRRGRGDSVPVAATGEQPGSVSEDLAGLVAHLKLERFVLVGHAGGGFNALDYACWKPAQVAALVIVASNGAFSEDDMQAYYRRLSAPFLPDDRKEFLEVGPTYRMANADGVAKWRAIEHDAKAQGTPMQPLRTPNTFEKVSEISCPVLVVSGGADLLSPPRLMTEWAQHIRSAEYHEFPYAGHALPWEEPDRFNSVLEAFISKHDV